MTDASRAEAGHTEPYKENHTWVIDTKTGHPYPERSLRYQANWGWSEGKSVDQLTDYMCYGLKRHA